MSGYVMYGVTNDQPAVQGPIKTFPNMLVDSTDVGPLVNLIKSLPMGSPVSCDTETTGLFPYEDDVIRGVSIAFRNPAVHHSAENSLCSFYIPVGYPDHFDNLSDISIRLIFQALKDREPFLVFHAAKFDIAFLRQLPRTQEGGVFFPFPRPTEFWDTKVVAWLLDENMPTGLKEQAAFHFGEDSKDEQKAIKKLVREKGWDGLTPADTYLYAAMDAELTLRLYERQLELIDHPSTLGDIRPAIERELAIQGVLGRMEATGILVNPELLEKMTEETAKAVAEIEAQFDININSPKQLAAFLNEQPDIHVTVTSTARDKLEALPSSPTVDLILKHRRLKKSLTSYCVPYKERMGRDGRLHAHFSSTGTVTGRYSSSAPNLQTIPRRDTLAGVRSLFIAEPGFELWSYDLKAAEMRVMGGMAQEAVLIEALESGADVHAALAEQVFGPNFTGLQRRYSKNVGFGFNYGLSSPVTASKYIAGPDGKKIAAKILDGLKKRYPAIVQLMRRTTREAEKAGYVAIGDAWPGRYRRFRSPSARYSAPFTALNAKIQGGIGEFVKDVMLAAEEPINHLGARLVLQVHDELVIEVPEGMGEKVGALLQEIATKLDPFDMPMLFDGQPWSSHE